MAILEWMIPQAADTIYWFLVGDDGRKAYHRVRHKNFHGKVYELGEQVLTKPKKEQQAREKKKGGLEPRFHDATWVGCNERSNEYIVVLKEGGPAIKVRTVGPKAEGERWSAIAIKGIVATPDMPNPKDDSQKHPRSERNTRSLDFGASGGQFLPKQGVHEHGLKRNFRINSRILEKYGPTMGCKGCENKMTGEDARPHSSECGARPEDKMRGDDVEAEIIARRDDRREQRAKVIAERTKQKLKKAQNLGQRFRVSKHQAVSTDNKSDKQKPTTRRESQMTPKNQEKHETRSKGWHA